VRVVVGDLPTTTLATLTTFLVTTRVAIKIKETLVAFLYKGNLVFIYNLHLVKFLWSDRLFRMVC